MSHLGYISDKSKRARPLILGLSVFGHDSSCALVDGNTGDILYSLTEERFSNIKHDGGFPAASLALLANAIDTEDLGCVTSIALNVDPSVSIRALEHELSNVLDSENAELFIQELNRILPTADVFHVDFFPLNYFQSLLGRLNISDDVVQYVCGKVSWYGNFSIRHRKLKDYCRAKFPEANVVSVDHHMCHAASAFYCSNFEASAVLTIDGQGEEATITLNSASNDGIKLISKTVWPHSLGALYMQIAWYLGFDGDPRYPGFGDEFKVMGMAAYGKPIYVNVFHDMAQVNDRGELQLNFAKYLERVPVEGCPGHTQPVFSKHFFETLGERRKPDDPILQKHYDIAHSGQILLEDLAVAIAKKLKEFCPAMANLCIAGGVGLNGLMNMQIYRKAGFQNIFIQPASGDDGTSLGAALYYYHVFLNGKRCAPLSNAYLGFDYGIQVIEATLEGYNLQYSRPESIHKEIGHLLSQGNIIARYCGRGEFGPRALGNRSILANPMLPNIKDDVNAKIKHRESFRPFAPACIVERVSEYFDIDIPSPYMLLICHANSGVSSVIPAVVHDDGTARVQTVSSESCPDLYKTLLEFQKYSGVPVLLNTSFNVNGEAIVETPQDAIESFLFMGIDYLAIGPYLVSRAENDVMHNRSTRSEHIQARKDRYFKKHFSCEMFLWSSANPIETELILLKQQMALYRSAAEARLSAIEKLDAEVQRLNGVLQLNASQ